MRRSIALITAIATTASIISTTAVAGTACSYAAADARFAQFLAAENLAGGAVLVGTPRGVLHERYFGSYGPDTVIPIASASKLLSGVRIAQLAESGALDLDMPVSTYLPQFTGLKGTMTTRQMFSHTSGFGDDSGSPIVFDDDLTLAQAVDQIACCVALGTGWVPGGQFAYGGVSMHVAGRVAEVVANADWQVQWQQHIGAPLGIGTIDWQAFGPTLNYGIAGSARSSLRDYGHVVHMLVNDGVGKGVRVLQPATVRAIATDHVGALPIAYAPPGAAGMDVHYGIGNWMELAPNRAPFIHSLGAFGFYPFVDFEDGLFGVFMVRGRAGVNEAGLPAYAATLAEIRAALAAGACLETEIFDAVIGDGFE